MIDGNVLNTAKLEFVAFQESLNQMDKCNQDELAGKLLGIYADFAQGDLPKIGDKMTAVLSRQQARTLLSLAEATVDYLVFHQGSNVGYLYKYLSSHGTAGQQRAIDTLGEIVKFALDNSSDFSDEGINALRDALIQKTSSIFHGKHSLKTYLENVAPASSQASYTYYSPD